MTGMCMLFVITVAIGILLAALGLHDLQLRLERWDYNRHAED
jgi:hypothetical protein